MFFELHAFGGPAKTTQAFLMILGARETGDHACSRESKIIQNVRLSTELESRKKCWSSR